MFDKFLLPLLRQHRSRTLFVSEMLNYGKIWKMIHHLKQQIYFFLSHQKSNTAFIRKLKDFLALSLLSYVSTSLFSVSQIKTFRINSLVRLDVLQPFYSFCNLTIIYFGVFAQYVFIYFKCENITIYNYSVKTNHLFFGAAKTGINILLKIQNY